MKDQRWPGDYETVPQEMRYSKMEEQMGMNDANRSHGNDYIASPQRGLDRYETDELEPSWSMQLDTVGMQPHAREYLERQENGMRSDRQYRMIGGQIIDHPPGIQFSGRP